MDADKLHNLSNNDLINKIKETEISDDNMPDLLIELRFRAKFFSKLGVIDQAYVDKVLRNAFFQLKYDSFTPFASAEYYKGLTDNGKWVEGILNLSEKGKSGYTLYCEHRNNPEQLDAINVQPETIRIFSGLTDCSRKKIFEGDILLNDNNKIEVVDLDFLKENGVCRYYDPHFERSTSFEVIGNVFDNPELLNSHLEGSHSNEILNDVVSNVQEQKQSVFKEVEKIKSEQRAAQTSKSVPTQEKKASFELG